MEAFNFYRDHVAFLYRHFDGFRHIARYFMTPVPFEVRYELSPRRGGPPLNIIRLVKSPITIGALFYCWEQCPELFRVTLGEKEGMVYSFNGSPFSGMNCYAAVCLETGETFSGRDDRNFRERCRVLDAVVVRSEEALAELQSRGGAKGFAPATLEELAAFVEENCVDPGRAASV